MRLIDADALNAALDRRLEDVGNTASTVFDIIVIAPTVSCEECRFQYSRPGYCYECDTDRPGFGCAYFERRQP